ncbi:dihydrofolate reductase family protein [Streptococcus iners]|uniref:Dihydrofolate reductase family protein n=1 Tax=Streptococcus iners TaxID=3028084 RepID=A0AA96VN01_9STRE|nr:dihydrofolate reductase family protein [Streptococcus sp. 29887]
MARRLVLNIAMSLDGYIARTDGSYDWIEGHGTDQFDTTWQFDNPAFSVAVIRSSWGVNHWKIALWR